MIVSSPLPFVERWHPFFLSLFFLGGVGLGGRCKQGDGREVVVLPTCRFRWTCRSQITLIQAIFFHDHNLIAKDSQQQSVTLSCSIGKEHCNFILTLCKCNYEQKCIYAGNFQQEALVPNRGWEESVRMHLRQGDNLLSNPEKSSYSNTSCAWSLML